MKKEDKIEFYIDNVYIFNISRSYDVSYYDLVIPKYDENDNYLKSQSYIYNLKVSNLDSKNKLKYEFNKFKDNNLFIPISNVVNNFYDNEYKFNISRSGKVTSKDRNIETILNNSNCYFSKDIVKISSNNNEESDNIVVDIKDFNLLNNDNNVFDKVKEIYNRLVDNEDSFLESAHHGKSDKIKGIMNDKMILLLNDIRELFLSQRTHIKLIEIKEFEGGEDRRYNYKICMFRKSNLSSYSSTKLFENEIDLKTTETPIEEEF